MSPFFLSVPELVRGAFYGIVQAGCKLCKSLISGGEGGIRTLGTRKRTTVFENDFALFRFIDLRRKLLKTLRFVALRYVPFYRVLTVQWRRIGASNDMPG